MVDSRGCFGTQSPHIVICVSVSVGVLVDGALLEVRSLSHGRPVGGRSVGTRVSSGSRLRSLLLGGASKRLHLVRLHVKEVLQQVLGLGLVLRRSGHVVLRVQVIDHVVHVARAKVGVRSGACR